MHTIHNKKGLKFLIAATTLWAGVALAQSGSYPNKPIKFIVPYPPARTLELKFRTTSNY